MKVFGVTGWKNAGKTTLMERLVAEIAGRGLSVSTLKHAHHGFDMDQPGKDSFRHREAGAREVLVASTARFAILHELRGAEEPRLEALIARLAPVDLVLVEGWKRDRHPKLEVWRRATGAALIAADDETIRAVVSDDAPEIGRPVLPFGDIARIADFALREATPL